MQPEPEQVSGPQKLPHNPPKALRFVTNYGGPQIKRRRIGAACLTCRKRKTACSGERPVCDTCKQNKLECAGYSAESNRRVASDTNTRPQLVKREKSNGVVEERALLSTGGQSTGSSDQVHKLLSVSSEISPRDRDPALANIDPGGNRDQDALFAGPRNRMPYFRWLGPTALMPGFKQMVVKVKRQDTNAAVSSNGDVILSPTINVSNSADQKNVPSIHSHPPQAVESDVRSPLSLPFCDTSSMPPSELITHLAEVFFKHLGCNYPFLQRDRFLRDLDEKQVDPVLVDAVCALAARFSTHTLITQQLYDGTRPTPAEYGHAFAQRAKAALTETFACPSVAAVQAALLLAYNEFGESRDSGLWMYLGIAIRMAQDLGLHKLQGLKYRGMNGPTPKMVKRASVVDQSSSAQAADTYVEEDAKPCTESTDQELDEKHVAEQKAVEQERVDTFWAVFFLDRVVSSGVGRRSTLRDKDIELSFPVLDENNPKSGWPAAFPALIRIVHLYGRVADLLNSITSPSDITPQTPKKLAAMEEQVTSFYQNLSPRLHFDAVNFQHYMKAGEGTNFVLLHFWFHTLIVLLHQPTLLKTFEGKMLQLFPNSRQLSMSSAKTIADILSYSQLIDAKASHGNPFTSQPISIAACAFLKETADQTASSSAQSRAPSPSAKDSSSDDSASLTATDLSWIAHKRHPSVSTGATLPQPEQKSLSKHSLLATAASQHYQLCYKALQSLETYWAGTKYILTILDQKFAGVDDPLLYTAEEGESSIEPPRPEPAFTSPGWRRKASLAPLTSTQNPLMKPPDIGLQPESPVVDPNKPIGWTLTGNMDSASTNVAWHYSSPNGLLHSGAQPAIAIIKECQDDGIAADQTLVVKDAFEYVHIWPQVNTIITIPYQPKYHPPPSRSLSRATMASADKPRPPPQPAYLPTPGSILNINKTLYDFIAAASRKQIQSFTLPPRSGRAWQVPAGHIVRISTPEGPQVGDLNIWNALNPRERFWAARTRQLHASHVSVYDRLWSCLPYLRPLVTIVGDSLGGKDGYGVDDFGGRCHDLLGTRCDPYVNNMLTGDEYDYHCHSNLVRAAHAFGLTEFDVHDVLNVFQVTGLNEEGKYFMEASPARKGDFIEFFTEQPVLMALSTCPGGDLSTWGWGEGGGGEEGEKKSMKDVCRALKVEVFAIEDRSVLEGWREPETPKYGGRHGMAVPVGEGAEG
ncbi:C6 transcription factor [Teratosphaeria destructans]|uniref:C6 transcription factor n=1 Tax=Teratosphaeria destructans TaxID=418781 RepID=A0A9W7SLU6_9PEZI|nr:C6 transcription factor [Teratosphaeria destructans]